MKRRNFRFIVLAFFLAFGISFAPSCNKDKSPCTNCPNTGSSDCEDIQNVKNFFAFKVGSWWVYEEETSGARDSVYVTQYQNDPSNYNFDVRVYSTYEDYYYHYWPVFASGAQSCNEYGSICNPCLTIKRSKYKPGDFVDQANFFEFLLVEGGTINNFNTDYPNNVVYIEDIDDSYTLGSFSFERTVRIFESHTFMEGQQATNHFISENIGLIKKELVDSNRIWNLIDYHIEQ